MAMMAVDKLGLFIPNIYRGLFNRIIMSVMYHCYTSVTSFRLELLTYFLK